MNSRNCIKKQEYAKFVKKSLTVNTLKIKIIIKLKTIPIIQVNTEVLHITCNLKYNIPNEIPVIFHNGYYFSQDDIILS